MTSARRGEGAAVAPTAAIANAVRDAVLAIGPEVNETPITPRRARFAADLRPSTGTPAIIDSRVAQRSLSTAYRKEPMVR